ncbi:MAG: glycoside hydrolase family 3 N-terminal domain-containing protein [Lacunisphaera sp.]|nr:glycoside hydrolase family 3 N-terminal domain-containing protein [Lacunisphaera sp.]
MKYLPLLAVVAIFALGRSNGLAAAEAPYQFMTPGSEIDRRAAALVREMTLAEKIGQMTQVDCNALLNREEITKYFLGSVVSGGSSDPQAGNTARDWADHYDAHQQPALLTRLKIPMLYGVDAVHGHNNVIGATIFPHNIGLGATRDPALVEAMGRVVAREIAATGVDWTFAPGVIVARDERWGRTYESFAEEPALVGELGAAFVRGLQMPSLADPTAILACAKHFLGDGGTTGGVDQGDTRMEEPELRRVFLAPYLPAIRAGVGSIMVSYSSWNGLKMHGHRYLLTDVLKHEHGFRGFLVSDWAAIDQLPGDFKSDIATSINAGLDMVMIPNGPHGKPSGKPNTYVEFITYLKELVQAGRVPLARIDDAVERILRVKLEMGLFEHPFTDRSLLSEVGRPAHRELARRAVRESLVLLKNENRTLPLAKTAHRLVLAGNGADDLGRQCGGWTISWQGKPGKVTEGGTTILEAFRQSVGPNCEITCSADASAAKGADAVVVVLAEDPYAEGKGDRHDLALPPGQLAVLRNAKASGAPVVLVLLSGRPLILDAALGLADAVVAAWLPGTEGRGLTDVLLGDHAPTGKLSFSWPRSMAQIPVNVGDATYDPLFPFGFGLTYGQIRK